VSDVKNEVMIQADKNIEFEIVKKVMYTCSKAGATDFTILVVNEE
jgi:biopolymer transport protein ExbD